MTVTVLRSFPGNHRRLWWLAAALLVYLHWGPMFASGSLAAERTAPEYQVKAAFLLNFTKFIEWPATAFADAQSPFAVCVLGEDPFGGVLDQIVAGETVNGRKLVIEKLRRPPAAKSCQVLFLTASQREPSGALEHLGPGVLTVGEADGFLRDGGMIRFVIENQRVRFDVNQKALENASLVVSSKLLNVARSVQR